MILKLRAHQLDLSRPVVMGILNVTPDSFFDGARHVVLRDAIDRAAAMIEEGARILDVGGESTRPGSDPVSEAEELQRVVPVIEALRQRFGAPISIDTMKPAVMRAAVAAGAALVNDVNALRAPGALSAVAESGAAACLMHMQGEPKTMQQAPTYGDVVAEVETFLRERLAAAEAAGIPRERLLVDPGFGFGKSFEHNRLLLRELHRVAALGVPLLVGLSRKGMLGQIGGLAIDRRLNPGLAAAALAVWQGASIVRAHDVRATREAIDFAAAIRDGAA
jgi:dihydropteroate synthase